MTAPMLHTRRLPEVVQAARKMEPHFVGHGSRKIDAGTKGALESRPSVLFVEHGAKLRGDRQE